MHKYIELFPENLTFEEINLGGRNVKYSKSKKGGKTGMRIRACLNFAQVNFANCFRGCFSDFMRRIAGYLTNKIGKTDRKQTKKNLIEYYFIGKFKQVLKPIDVSPQREQSTEEVFKNPACLYALCGE